MGLLGSDYVIWAELSWMGLVPFIKITEKAGGMAQVLA
jgi:hypothetical protein